MAVSYNRLWKLLVDRKMSKADLRKASGVAPNTMTNSTFKWIKNEYAIRFAYEATDKIIRFTDYKDIKYRSRTVFSFHRPETLRDLLRQPDTIRNNMKHFPPLDTNGFRKCQINAINNLDQSFADNRPKALVQMATGAGKTFTAITAAYRLLKYGNVLKSGMR